MDRLEALSCRGRSRRRPRGARRRRGPPAPLEHAVRDERAQARRRRLRRPRWRRGTRMLTARLIEPSSGAGGTTSRWRTSRGGAPAPNEAPRSAPPVNAVVAPEAGAPPARTVAPLEHRLGSGSPPRRSHSTALIAAGARKPTAISQKTTPDTSQPTELPSSRGGSRPRSMKFQPSARKSTPTIAGQPILGPSAQVLDGGEQRREHEHRDDAARQAARSGRTSTGSRSRTARRSRRCRRSPPSGRASRGRQR